MKTAAAIVAALALVFMWPLGVGHTADVPTTRPVEAAPPAWHGGGKTVIVELSGEIDDFNRDRLMNRIEQARSMGADTVILNVDTYGGMVVDGLDISRFIKRQTNLHTIAFVQDKAISAGAMIAMACDEIVMSNSATLGDCAPIVFNTKGELEAMPAAERAKAESPILLDFGESAQRNHHDPLLAAKMVDVSRVVFWVEKDGEKRFVNSEDYYALKATGWKDCGDKVPVADDRVLLTVDSQHAVQYGLATGIAESAQELAGQRGYNIVADLTPGIGERLVVFLSSPLVRSAIMGLFFLCIFVIPHAPGHGVAESIGLGALVLMVVVPMLAGYAQWWELLIIFLGLGLIALEILLPGHMVPGLSGAVLVLLGLSMTFVQRSFSGEPHFNLYTMRTGLVSVAGALGTAIVLAVWLARYLPKIPYFGRLVLTTTVGGGTNLDGLVITRPNVHVWPPLGSIGKATTDLRPGGAAEFFDSAIGEHRVVSVVCETGFVAKGTELLVREVTRARVLVRVNNT